MCAKDSSAHALPWPDLTNQIRGLLAEFGLVVPQGLSHVCGNVPELIEHASNELPGTFRLLIVRLLDHLKKLDRQVSDGACQAGCRVSYAAKGWVALLLKCSSMTESRSGLSVTTSM